MTSQLSWQPPPVTKCGECPKYDDGQCWENERALPVERYTLYIENSDGITSTCPMYQQQNKEVK